MEEKIIEVVVDGKTVGITKDQIDTLCREERGRAFDAAQVVFQAMKGGEDEERINAAKAVLAQRYLEYKAALVEKASAE